MPRDGSDIYYIPPGTEGIPDSTIESIKYNTFIADVEQDLNHPRPIVAGGTGASTAEDALLELSGEMAYQVVTNFDSYVYTPGSFYADSAATGAPVAGHPFAGIVYQANLAGDLVVEARDLTNGVIYVRISSSGVWSTWGVDNVSQFVKKSGDTMTGLLVLPATALTNQLHAATKDYVDKSVPVYISTTPPTGAAILPGSLWWESDTGLMYVLYDDGTSIQWVIASPQPDLATFVLKGGDTMTGDLTISKAAGVPAITLNPAEAAQQALVNFNQTDVLKWQLGKHTDGGFLLYANGPGLTALFFDATTALATVVANPTAPLGIATKQYVDGKVPAAATAAEYIANSAPTKMLTPGAVWAAALHIDISTDAASVAADFGSASIPALHRRRLGATSTNANRPIRR